MNEIAINSPRLVRFLDHPITLACSQCETAVEVVGFTENGDSRVLCLNCIREAQLRGLLGVSPAATAEDILRTIKNEGWIPAPLRQRYGDQVEFFCSVYRKDRLQEILNNREQLQIVHEGFPTPALAALNALRLARGLPTMQ